eukprot:313947_1
MEINIVKVIYGSIQLEIYLSGLIAKLLSNKTIKKYKINYIEHIGSKLEQIGIDMFVTKNKVSAKNAFVNQIYETNCISFVELNTSTFFDLTVEPKIMFVQIIAMDSYGNIIDKSQWTKMEPYIDFTLPEHYETKQICHYFDKEVDVNKKCNINKQDWVSAISNIEIFKKKFDEFDCKKIFHYIQNIKDLSNVKHIQKKK